MFRIKFFILISIFMVSTVSAQTLKMGYIEFPPVFSTDKSGKPEGLLIDLAKAVVPHAGYQLQVNSYPVKRMVDYIVKGKLDLWIGLKTIPAFKDTTFKGDSNLLQITLKAFRVGDKPDIKEQEDLKDKKIIIIRGFSYGGWINYITDPVNEINYIETYEHIAAFRMLKAGRADYLLDYSNPAKKALKTIKIENLECNTISSFGAYFVVSKKTNDAEIVLHNLETSYKALKEKGEL